MSRDPFGAASAALTSATLTDDLCAPFVHAIEVAGAAVSTLGNPFGSQTVCASDATASRIDEIQIDLGEGPCWQSLVTRVPVLAPDLQLHEGERWPVARDALRSTGVGGLYAFPLFVGAIDVGSVDLYTVTPLTLSAIQIEHASALARILTRQVMRRSMAALDEADRGMPGGSHSRREVHQATGMLAAQMKVAVGDAALFLRAHAFAEGMSVLEVANDVIDRRRSFTVET